MTVENMETDKIDQQENLNLKDSVVDFNHVLNLVNMFENKPEECTKPTEVRKNKFENFENPEKKEKAAAEKIKFLPNEMHERSVETEQMGRKISRKDGLNLEYLQRT